MDSLVIVAGVLAIVNFGIAISTKNGHAAFGWFAAVLGIVNILFGGS